MSYRPLLTDAARPATLIIVAINERGDSLATDIADIKKSGGRVRDVIRKRLKGRRELEVPVDDTFVIASDYEDEDVKIEREKVARMTSIETEDGGSEGDSSSQPIVVVKVRKLLPSCSNLNL